MELDIVFEGAEGEHQEEVKLIETVEVGGSVAYPKVKKLSLKDYYGAPS